MAKQLRRTVTSLSPSPTTPHTHKSADPPHTASGQIHSVLEQFSEALELINSLEFLRALRVAPHIHLISIQLRPELTPSDTAAIFKFTGSPSCHPSILQPTSSILHAFLHLSLHCTSASSFFFELMNILCYSVYFAQLSLTERDRKITKRGGNDQEMLQVRLKLA